MLKKEQLDSSYEAFVCSLTLYYSRRQLHLSYRWIKLTVKRTCILCIICKLYATHPLSVKPVTHTRTSINAHAPGPLPTVPPTPKTADCYTHSSIYRCLQSPSMLVLSTDQNQKPHITELKSRKPSLASDKGSGVGSWPCRLPALILVR